MTRTKVDKVLKLPITDREQQLLDESLDAYYRDPEAGTPWPEARADLLRQL